MRASQPSPLKRPATPLGCPASHLLPSDNCRPVRCTKRIHRRSTTMISRISLWLLAVPAFLLNAPLARAQCPPSTPIQGAAPPAPLPVFPRDNWWNLDISAAPLDSGSSSYIAFVNNGGTRRLHPDFGGEVSPGSADIYGMPYAIVDGAQAKQA